MTALLSDLLATTGSRAACRVEVSVGLFCSDPVMFAGRAEKSTESRMATPSVPPIWRKKVAELVATPIWVGFTDPWLAIVSVCMSWPRPSPMKNIAIIRNQSGLSTVTKVRMRKPMPVEKVPVIGKIR